MKKASPDVEARIVAMREAGYTVSVIAAHNGCSTATVNRICKRNSVSKRAIAQEIIDEARTQLRESIGNDTALQEIAASVVVDTRHHFELLRAKLEEAASKLEINDPQDAKSVFRSLNSYANALKLSTDAMRSALKIDPTENIDEDALPTLTIECLSDEEVAELRREQAAEESVLYGYSEEEEAEVVEYH